MSLYETPIRLIASCGGSEAGGVEVGLIVAGIGVREAIISQEVFTVVVVLVLMTTLVTPLLLRYVFPRPLVTPAPARSAVSIKER